MLGDLDELPPTANGWDRATACHNTVVVDGLNQRESIAQARTAAPAGQFLYVPNPSTDTVSGFTIGAAGTLTPVPGVAFAAGKSPAAAGVDPSGKFVYVVNSGTTTISQYTIDSVGDLTAITGTAPAAGTNAGFITFDPDGKFVYVGNLGSASITQFTISSSGALSSTSNILQIGSAPRVLALTK